MNTVQPTNQPTNQSINQSFNQSVNQLHIHTNHQSVNQSSIHRSIKHSMVSMLSCTPGTPQNNEDNDAKYQNFIGSV